MIISRFVLFVLLCSLILSACSGENGGASAIPGGSVVEQPVDPIFQDFYRQLGGVELLGPVISPLFLANQVRYQYTLNVLLAFDPELPDGRRYYLAPLGLDMGIQQPPEPLLSDPALRYIDGHVLAPDFIPLYERLGARLVGSPLTAARYNPEKQRYEQYFTNIGIYRLDDEPRDSLRLMAYGDWKCSENCPGDAALEAGIHLPPPIAPAFIETVNRLGPPFTGLPLAEVYTAADGQVEQPFENMVLAFRSDQPGRVFLRPVSLQLGIPTEVPGFQHLQDGTTFVAVSADRGFNVANIFTDYLAQHGGLDISGAPLGEAVLLREGVLRQCFVNLCLEEHRNERYPFRVRASALGYSYRRLPAAQASTPTTPPNLSLTPTAVSVPGVLLPTATSQPAPSALPQGGLALQAWERHAVLAPGLQQEITVKVFRDNRPVANIEPDLILFLPDGTRKVYYMYPTGDDGRSVFLIDLLDFPPGSSIPYQVCAYDQSSQATCVERSFLLFQ